MSTTATINLDELQAKVKAMSPEELQKIVFDAKVKQRVATKKYYNPETAKRARLKKAEEIKAAAAQLAALPAPEGSGFANMLEYVNSEAGQEADRKLSEETASEAGDE